MSTDTYRRYIELGYIEPDGTLTEKGRAFFQPDTIPDWPPFDAVKYERQVKRLVDILCDLDEFDRPKVKLPKCPRCEEDELGVVRADLLMCYRCGWKIEAKTSAKRCPACGGTGVMAGDKNAPENSILRCDVPCPECQVI